LSAPSRGAELPAVVVSNLSESELIATLVNESSSIVMSYKDFSQAAPIADLNAVDAGICAPAGTLVNIVWVGYDLVRLSVIVRTALYKGFTPSEATSPDTATDRGAAFPDKGGTVKDCSQ
jgi:hypothetical protein